ncbi:exported hypothetical protein [Magnetospirillum sp. UT-4]|nr:exported hypothetical protein [Magnetospirillum sp. UT-4]
MVTVRRTRVRQNRTWSTRRKRIFVMLFPPQTAARPIPSRRRHFVPPLPFPQVSVCNPA